MRPDPDSGRRLSSVKIAPNLRDGKFWKREEIVDQLAMLMLYVSIGFRPYPLINIMYTICAAVFFSNIKIKTLTVNELNVTTSLHAHLSYLVMDY